MNLANLAADLGRVLVRDAPGRSHDHPPLQHERRGRDRVVAVDQHALHGRVVVVVPQVVDHVGRPEVRRLRAQRVLVAGAVVAAARDVRPGPGPQVLRGDVALEHVLEVGREREVDVEEVRHVDDVVDDLAAVRALDQDRVPGPVGPVGRERALDPAGSSPPAAAGCPPGRARRTAGRSAPASPRTWSGPAAAPVARTGSRRTGRPRPSASRGTGRRSCRP